MRRSPDEIAICYQALYAMPLAGWTAYLIPGVGQLSTMLLLVAGAWLAVATDRNRGQVPIVPLASPVADRAYPNWNGDRTQPTVEHTNTLAIVGFVLVWFTVIGGIVCGHVALSQIRRTGERGRGLAVAALVIGYVLLGLILVLYIMLGVLLARISQF